MRHLLRRHLRGIPIAELLLVGVLVATLIVTGSWGLLGVFEESKTVEFTKTSQDYGEFITDPQEAFVPQP